MERIRTADLAGIDPVTGKNIFVERLLPQIGTQLKDYWHNAVQEEISNVIEMSGLPLNPADNTQLLQAIKRPHAIVNNLTINVNPAGGADFATIQAALDSLIGRYIMPDVLVTIQLSPTDHLISSNIRVRHPQGKQILIKGASNLAGANPYRLRIQQTFAGGQVRTAFFADRGEIIEVQGVRVWGNADVDNLTYGAYAWQGGIINFKHCVIEQIFGIGCFANNYGRINFDTCKVQSIYPLSSSAFGYAIYLRDYGVSHAFDCAMADVQVDAVYIENYCQFRLQNSGIAKGAIYAVNDCLIELTSCSFPAGMTGILIQYGCKVFMEEVFIGDATIQLKDSYAKMKTVVISKGHIMINGTRVDADDVRVTNPGSTFGAWNLGRMSSVYATNNQITNAPKGYLMESLTTVEGTTTFTTVTTQYSKFVPGDVTAVTP